MTPKTDKHTLSNGLVILGEQMEQVGSVAFSFRLPAGTSRFGQGCCGAGAVISDWVFRGAGKRDSKELIEALDGLGLHRDSSVSSNFMSFGAALEAGNLGEAIELYSDIILAPTLDSDQFELSRQLALLGVAALDDEPRQKVMLKLYEAFYPHPFGLPAVGKSCELERLTKEDAAAIVKEKFNLITQEIYNGFTSNHLKTFQGGNQTVLRFTTLVFKRRPSSLVRRKPRCP